MTIAIISEVMRPHVEGRLPQGVEAIFFAGADDLPARAADAEIAWLDPIDPALAGRAIAGMPRLRWYNAMSSGVDWLPLDLLRERGAVLTNGAGIHAQSVAEFAIMGMLDIAKGWRKIVRAQDRREWLGDPPGKRELLDAEVLIVGAGEIGRRIEAILKAFGARVTMGRRSAGPGELDGRQWRAALRRFDWTVLIVPSTAETRGMIGAAELAAMKPGAVVVNLARGTVIDQEALLDSLASGHLGGAYLDVTDPEPLPPDHPLWTYDNVHISMHLAGKANAALFERGAARFLSNLERYCRGEELAHRVDLEKGY